MRYLSLLALFYCSYFFSYAMMSEELVAVAALRTKYGNAPYRSGAQNGYSVDQCMAQLQSNGQFTYLVSAEKNLRNKNAFNSIYSSVQGQVNDFLSPCFNRLWCIAENYRKKTIPDNIKSRFYQSVLYYGALETSRSNVGGRFHASCFAIPTAAVNIYFCMLPVMDSIESGAMNDTMSLAVNSMLKKLGMQAWTQPFRNDSTDNHVVSVDRFRKHVWWVGGNGICYRSLLPVAAMHHSAVMIDVVSKVAKGSMSVVSQANYDTAFWTEGLTADGVGWGHGRQCLVWGYPIDGLSASLGICAELYATPWCQKMERKNVEALMNYIRGSAFYYHNGYVPPLFDRSNATSGRVHRSGRRSGSKNTGSLGNNLIEI